MSVEAILQDIDREIASLAQARSVLMGLGSQSNGTRAVAPSAGQGSRFSATARRKMAAAQKARWAKYRAAKNKTGAAKPIRIISAAARRKMAAAQRARWNAYRAGKAKGAKKAA